MSYGPHVRAGVMGAVLAPALWIVALFVRGATGVAQLKASGAAVGSWSVLIDSNHLLLAAAAGFAAGWLWRARRSAR